MNSFEDQLRHAFEAEAATVEVSPGALPEIRRRVAARRMRWLPRTGAFFATGGAVLASVVAIVVGIGSCDPRATPPPPAATSTAPTPTVPAVPAPTAPTPTVPGPSGPAGPTGVPAGTASLPVYYVAEDRAQLRLYREFHPLRVGDGSVPTRVRAAVTEMLAIPAYDPDYRTLWPAGATVRGVRVDGGVVTVDLAGAARNSVGAEAASIAVQQLVWTVAGVVGGDTGVRLLLDGAPAADLWGHVNARDVLRKAPMVDVQGRLWLISPQHGATVGRSFEVHLAGFVFEATAQLRVRRGGTVVDQRVVTLDNGAPSLGQARVRLTLTPGSYLLEVYAISPADGSVQHLDNHQITVR